MGILTQWQRHVRPSAGTARWVSGRRFGYATWVLLAAALLFLGAPLARAQTPGEEVVTSVTGILDVVILENFEERRSEMAYFVQDQRARRYFELVFEGEPPGHLKTGQRVTARGRAKGPRLWVEALDEEEGSASSPPPIPDAQETAQSTRRAVVLMVDLVDAKASDRYTLDGIAETLWTGAQSTDGMYREASLGQLNLPADTDGNGAPDVFGPFAIPNSGQTCDYYAWAYAAEDAAQAAGIDLSLYQHRVFVLPRSSELACTWGGVANVGCGTYCRAWIANASLGMLFAHELGHNLNMGHARTDPENDGQSNSEYGDHSDPMGSSGYGWHVFNAAHIDQMGWYAPYPGSIQTVGNSGIYDISPIGVAPVSTGLPHALKIAKPDSSEHYYLSYRQPLGYDATLSSTYAGNVNVHRYQGSGYGYTYFIQSLADGGAFVDAANAITVRQLGHNAEYATVEVAFGSSCLGTTPTVGWTPASRVVQPGGPVSYSVNVDNNDSAGCGPTVFELAYAGPLADRLSPASLSLAAGASGAASFDLDLSGLGDGVYPLEAQAWDDDGQDPAHAEPGIGAASLTIDGTPPEAPTGLTGTSDRKGRIQLAWTAAVDALSGVGGYTVYRDGAVLAQTTGTGYTDADTVAGIAYRYTVTASDAAGNVSAPSAAASVTAGSSGSKGGGNKGGGGKGGGRKK